MINIIRLITIILTHKFYFVAVIRNDILLRSVQADRVARNMSVYNNTHNKTEVQMNNSSF